MSWSSRPMLAFDTESSGTDVEKDRIVTACLAWVNMRQPEKPIQWLLDPGVEIPAEATAVHGITTERAREHGKPPRSVLPAIREKVISAWELGYPLVAFNAPFDLTLLDRELCRYGFPALDVHGLVVDPLVLDRYLDKWRKGSRKLDAVCRQYQVPLDGAHDATQDAVAAARVAWRMFRTFPELDAMDADDLYALQVTAHRDWADGFESYLRTQGKGDVIDRAWPVRPWRAAA